MSLGGNMKSSLLLGLLLSSFNAFAGAEWPGDSAWPPNLDLSEYMKEDIRQTSPELRSVNCAGPQMILEFKRSKQGDKLAFWAGDARLLSTSLTTQSGTVRHGGLRSSEGYKDSAGSWAGDVFRIKQ